MAYKGAYPLGLLTAGGVEILQVLEGRTWDDLTYRVRCLHCQRVFVLGHSAVFSRVRNGSVHCMGCRYDANKYVLATGLYRDIGLEILGLESELAGKTTRYRVRLLCCGRERSLQQATISDRGKRGISRCTDCLRHPILLTRPPSQRHPDPVEPDGAQGAGATQGQGLERTLPPQGQAHQAQELPPAVTLSPDQKAHLWLFQPASSAPALPALPLVRDPARAWPRPPVLAAQSTPPWVQEALWGTP